MDYLIRKVEEKDLNALINLCQHHAEYEKVFYNPVGKYELLKQSIFSEKPLLFCFVIEIKTIVAGYFTYTFDFSTWDGLTFLYLDCLYLEPDFRGMRIGEKVFERLKLIAEENNCINIQWQTPVFNERAIKFYNRIGATGKEKVRFFINM